MDRKVLLAMVLIMVVLLADQLLLSKFYRPRPKPTPSQQGGSPAPAESGRADGAAGSGVQTGSGTRTGAGSVPASGTVAPGGALGSAPGSAQTAAAGAMAARPRVPDEPILEREIETDRFKATFTTRGASIEHWVLDTYKDAIRKAPVDLIPPGARAFHVMVDAGDRSLDFSDTPFRLTAESQMQGMLAFEAEDSSGIRVTKTFRLSADRRLLDADVRVAAPPEMGPIRYRIGWVAPLPLTERYAKPAEIEAVALLGTKLETVHAQKLGPGGEKTLPPGNVRWVASRSKYFIAAVVPDSGTVSDVVFRAAGPGAVAAWIAGSAPPGAEVARHARIYAGPIHYETLAAVGSGLDEVANLGWQWMRGVSVLMLTLLNLLYKVFPNYGVAIIILSAATKLLFYPLTQSSLRSMKVMHHLQPRIKELQERHKGDAMKLNKAMMALYKENKVNPMSGCLPMILQIPVFIALYNVLLFSIELRASGFVGYIQDLSAPDLLFTVAGFPIHLLPIVMTASTYLLQAQTPVAPAQKGMMYVMPLFMLFFMYTFPAGVILYWTVNNLLSALQQYLVNLAEDRKLAAQG
ncbi:MAG: membrane protein insertase YidC [Candidatus Latescibacteria bacterium]|nr:membrane protein insertase YidC [Candidatus Latescibacterota bacterium]